MWISKMYIYNEEFPKLIIFNPSDLENILKLTCNFSVELLFFNILTHKKILFFK